MATLRNTVISLLRLNCHPDHVADTRTWDTRTPRQDETKPQHRTGSDPPRDLGDLASATHRDEKPQPFSVACPPSSSGTHAIRWLPNDASPK